MEPQQQQANEDGVKSNFLCRQSSTRWTPTSEQIRILKDLYYNNGVRSPTGDQIQRITARLSKYGKIEGKNVFYWFQNHKARERQKKRFTTDIPTMQRSGTWRSDQDQYSIYTTTKYPNICPGVPSSSSSIPAGMVAVGQMGSYGYGSVTMEKSFRECSISAGCNGGGGGGGSISNNFWVGGADNPYCSSYYAQYPLVDKIRNDTIPAELENIEEEQEDQQQGQEIETLPLFPMHGEDGFSSSDFTNIMIKPNPSDSYYTGWYRSDDIGQSPSPSRASLELSLYSYAGRSST